MLTLATQVIDRCRSLGIDLSATTRGIKCLAPPGTMTADLQAIVKVKSREIRDALIEEEASLQKCLKATFDDCPVVGAAVPRSWSAETGALADFVLLLTHDDLPPAPFTLQPHSVVVDTEKYLGLLQDDVRKGPCGPRARTDALQLELHRIRDLLLDNCSSTSVQLES